MATRKNKNATDLFSQKDGAIIPKWAENLIALEEQVDSYPDCISKLIAKGLLMQILHALKMLERVHNNEEQAKKRLEQYSKMEPWNHE